MAEEIIVTRKIAKRYRDVQAVSDLSIDVRKGEIYGFLGLNGAGKTTTIRMILGMVHPTSGDASLKGQKVNSRNREIWKDVGYLVEVPYAYPNLTVRENLEISRRLRLIHDRKAVDEIIEKLKLSAYAHRKAGNLSLGNAQRLGLAKAMIHNPSILILDEPANGLDPAGIYEIRKLLIDLAANQGVTIFISSHILGEVSRFATRIGIIHEGRLIQEVGSHELERLRQKRLLLNGRHKKEMLFILKEKGYSLKETEGGILECRDNQAVDHPDEIARLLVGSDYPPTLLQVAEEDLESYFFRTIGINEN